MRWQDHITSDPQVCHGKPCVRGTRVLVSVILDNLADGETHERIMEGYHVDEADIMACLRFAADLAKDQFLSIPSVATA